MYTGADISKVAYPYASDTWTVGSESYVKEAVNYVNMWLQRDVSEFNVKIFNPNTFQQSPFSDVEYRPDLDTTS